MARITPDHEEHAQDGRGTMLIWAGLFLCMALYAKVPQIDLSFSARYFDSARGFIHANDPLVRLLYLWTPPVGRTILALLAVFSLLAPWLARLAERQGRTDTAMRCRTSWRHMAVIAVICGVIGPGLLIEGVFKNTVGRPRPVQVEQFGGNQPFHGPFQPGDDPDSHRSFVSSHAATGFWLMSLGLTAGPVWRRRWLLIGVVAGAVIGMGRIMQGGHFLSDIIFAFYAVWVPCELVAQVDRWRLTRHQPPPSRPHRPRVFDRDNTTD